MKPKEDTPSSEQDAASQAAIAHPNSAEATSAPEVPAHIAKQFGLPHTPVAKKVAPVPDVATGPLTPTAPSSAPQEVNPLVDNPDTDAAVDDILNKESDELLGIQDNTDAHREKVPRGGSKLKRFFRAWWRKKWARYGTILIIIAALVAVAVIPKVRYAVLNTFGVRSSASVIVLDNTTQLPLKNVTVNLGSAKTQTNKDGVATLTDLKLGDYQLQVQRLAFASYKRSITVGWGSNPLGNVKLTAVGLQYHIQVKNYLSGKPIVGAEVESAALNALSDASGNIVLTLDDTNTTTLDVTLHADGYRAENITLDAASKADTSVQLVPSQKSVFVAKQSGKYDVYSSDLDGKNKKLLLAGTGNENNTVSLVVSPDNTQAALVSTRDNIRDADGYLLYALTFINVAEGTSTVVDHAQQIQLVDWIGSRLIYRSTTAGASAANPQRNRLLAYNYGSNSRVQLATANQFNTIVSAEGYIYYGVSSTDPNAQLGLFRVNQMALPGNGFLAKKSGPAYVRPTIRLASRRQLAGTRMTLALRSLARVQRPAASPRFSLLMTLRIAGQSGPIRVTARAHSCSRILTTTKQLR